MIKVAGAGPGNPNLLTIEVKDLIKTSEIVVAFGRIKESLQSIRKSIIEVHRVDELIEVLNNTHSDILILASGDPNFFGIVDLLKRKGLEIAEVLPGISSFQYFCAKVQKPYSQIQTISVHGRDIDFSKLEKDKSYGFLIDDKNNGSFISKSLFEMGFRGKIYFGYNLSYDDEIIIQREIGELIDEPSNLGVVLVMPYVD